MDVDNILPSEQRTFSDLPKLSEREVHRRREWVFLVLSGLFLGTLAMLNLIGITRFLDLSLRIPVLDVVLPLPVAVGVLPYPLTFLCTDLVSELYGKRRANQIVWVGFALNAWIVAILFVGGALPGKPSPVFDGLRSLAFSAVTASMVAYLLAQLVDVRIFHFLKEKTQGRHLWLRNNASTMVSQAVDTIAVILITHYHSNALGLVEGESVLKQLLQYIVAGYLFKFVVALLDTLPMYWFRGKLKRYLRLP